MEFAEKLRGMRKKAGLSQEQLAKELHVSRQAIAKWEAGGGIPDIDNMRAVSAYFECSLDELFCPVCDEYAKARFLYSSVTEIDVDTMKDYDIQLCGVNTVTVAGSEHEKMKVFLYSDDLSSLERLVKVRIDSVKERMDVDFYRADELSEAKAKESLFVRIELSQKFLRNAEISGNVGTLRVEHMRIDSFQFGGKTEKLDIKEVQGHIEADINQDVEINCGALCGKLDINQISSTSKVSIPAHTAVKAVKKGRTNHIRYAVDGKQTDDFSEEDAALTIELAGYKSELIIEKKTGL